MDPALRIEVKVGIGMIYMGFDILRFLVYLFIIIPSVLIQFSHTITLKIMGFTKFKYGNGKM
ncbi:MAG: hypothetical protein DRN53_01965 [Thermoprotei archaeon]|nr:MAG: hypothetical protein DRN53_01965 [Thermoprotei archaeon]